MEVESATKPSRHLGRRPLLSVSLMVSILGLGLGLGSAPATAHDLHSHAEDGSVSHEAHTHDDEGVAVDEDADGAASDSERIDKVESAVDVLAEELSKAFTEEAVPEKREMIGALGLGPSAGKVYRRDKGLSIGGYGDIRFQANLGAQDNIYDALRAVLYVGYKFNDRFVFNSELEFEHSGTGGGGSVSAEFITLDYRATDFLGLRGGLVLIPMGFINEVHEPTTYFGAERPEVERQIIPTTWRENGVGVFGTITDRVHYRMYAVNGFNAQGFSVKGLRGGRQKGGRALANDWAYVGRIDGQLIPGMSLGGSVYVGNSGQDQIVCTMNCTGPAPPDPVMTPVPDVLTTLYEIHLEYRTHGFLFRGLFTQAFLQDTLALNAVLLNEPGSQIAEQMLGAYIDVGYDVLPLFLDNTRMSLEPFFRYERLDTQSRMAAVLTPNLKYRQNIYTVGLNFKPIPQVVVKLDYRHITPDSGPADVANQVQFSFGYAF
jgi:hypothetical protein